MAGIELVTINGLDLTIPGAWALIDPTPLLGEAGHRGGDRTAPGVAGRRHRPRTPDGLEVVLAMYVYGKRDENGDPHADRRLGLRDNLRTLRADLLPPYSALSTSIVHTFTDETSVEGTCIVNEVEVQGAHDPGKGHVALVNVDLVVLEGRLS